MNEGIQACAQSCARGPLAEAAWVNWTNLALIDLQNITRQAHICTNAWCWKSLSTSLCWGKWRNMAIASGEPPWALPKQKQNGGGTAWPLQAAMFLFFSGGLAFGCKWNWKNPHEHLAWDHATCTHTTLRKIENSESLSIESLSSYPFYLRVTFHIFFAAPQRYLWVSPRVQGLVSSKSAPGDSPILNSKKWRWTPSNIGKTHKTRNLSAVPEHHPQYVEICRMYPLLYFNSLPCQMAQYGTN